MDAFTIKDIENLTGVKAHTIRIWEQRYSFLQPSRTETNIRYYSSSELQQLLRIALLNKFGYRISEIDRMSAAEINEKIISLEIEEARQEYTVNSLIEAMIDLRIQDIDDILSLYIRKKGPSGSILDIIFPFLDKIGLLWLSNHIQPAQEHLVSNIIRQKIILGIESLGAGTKKSSALLFLPEGEHHELALLFIHFMLKRQGVSVSYLGVDTPLSEVVYTVNKLKPDLLYSHITAPARSFKLDKFILELHNAVEVPVVLTGVFTHSYTRKLPPGFRIIRSLPEVLSFVQEQ